MFLILHGPEEVVSQADFAAFMKSEEVEVKKLIGALGLAKK